MKKYLALYMARTPVMEQMKKATPQQMKEAMNQWMKWAKSNEDSILELGALSERPSA